ncbi:hypothetical protein [Methylobacterium gnaphalii]|uniref:Transmembrane protein n=1 Tax=Methylobacterium gnaphalii TaxID=1010610 RepID=A0A512JPG5_9HYPH|nr:hypothetical protein [Methylobacterium gnaphalii]GEP11841.1 hypothetical protein MGN01_36860 [Methylobacterium gnaphalii]GJD69424.1 hypothetical protein MMMDOFMJ_2355 [Methylobacterium gnaphalii]GLS49619.1 hypothetical protein GCM10007885_24680 [Methylobacterium gnaphalii]
MSETLPAPAVEPPNIMAIALARAAAELALQDVGKRAGATLDRDAVEEIVDEALREAFKRIGVDLSDHKSIAAFNTTIAHAERNRTLWDRIGGLILTGLVTAIVGVVLTALGKYAVGGFR